jgi:hypothetical protein
LQVFQDTVTKVRHELQRPIFIAEFAYPAGTVREGMFASWNHALDNYPLNDEGQAKLLHDLVAWGVNAGVSGIRPWAPEVTVTGWEPFSLFSRHDKTISNRPGLGAIAAGVAAAGH